MGCGTSKSNTITEKKPISRGTHPLVTTQANAFQKIRAIDALKKDEAFLIQKILKELTPTENLGTSGENFTFLHAAACFNSFQVMDVLISWLKENTKVDVKDYMNIKDAAGNTPVVHCIIKESIETLYVLIDNDAIDFNYKDKKGHNLIEICHKFASSCLDVLEKAKKGKQPEQEEQKKLDIIAEKINRTKTLALEQEGYRKASATDNCLLGVPKDSQVYKLITQLMKSEENFKDPDLPTNVSSITTDRDHPEFQVFGNAVWKRPHEIFECDYKDIHLFDNIDPHDIAQGLLGVCYLLSSLSALAEFPSRLTPIYLNTKANKYGVYGLRVYIRGVPTEIVVDDYFPCFEDKNLPLFARPKGRELWVLLAEKVWAKIYKNYIACEIGFMDEALECLLGAPAARHITAVQEVDEIWQTIAEADKSKFVITAGTHKGVTEEMGLVPNHGYSIISAHTYKKHRILKLRNPWGKFEWKGDFGDNSKLWTKEMKEKIGYSNADDGQFCMKIEDFKKCFSFYSIGMYHDGWQYTYVEAESKAHHGEYFKFKIDDPCEAYFRIHQDDKRNKDESENYEYSSGDLVVCRVEKDGTLYNIFNQQGVDLGIFFGAKSIYPKDDLKVKLEKPGEYIIRAKIRWRNEKEGKFTLSAYAPVKINLERIEPVKNYLTRMLKNVGQKSELRTFPPFNFKLYSGFYSHYIFIYLQNDGQLTWNFNATFDQMENVRLSKYKRTSEDSFHVMVPPGKVEILIAKKVDVAAKAAFNFQIS